LIPLGLAAQFVAPAASPPATTTAEVGYTNLRVDYHRPGVRGRLIFGDMVPWSRIWRAGANENTLLQIDARITIGDTVLLPGQYSMYLIPEAGERWTWVINEAQDNWGTRAYDPRKDIVRVAVKAKRLPERIETLEYRFMNVRPQAVDLVLEWEWFRITLPIALPTNEEVAKRASLALNPAQSPAEYYTAARYYFDNDLGLQKAKAWMDRWAAAGEARFGPIRYQALIERALGNNAKATRLMQRSLALAREKNNKHYIDLNEASLRSWQREVVELSADSVLTRSIRYHDPDSNWGTKAHMLQLGESRPNASTRYTQISIYPTAEAFDFKQIREGDNVQLRLMNGAYSFSHLGRTNIPDSTRLRLRLTEERTRLLRDYYTYLWGLPMKLKDPGTLLQPTVHKVWFADKELLELEVQYAPDTGGDIWFFYFDPQTFALNGYAFYHKEDGPGTGEYILLEGEALVDNMLLPAVRHWYYTEDNLYLGTDKILK
ncbi:MAG: DUF6503 family protein, partial [Bacteroidota bacterium]